MTPETDPSSSTPEIDAILNELAQLCVARIENNEPFDDDRALRLVQSLKVNGWERHSSHDKPLRDQLRDRVFDALPHSAHPRRSELDGLLGQIQHQYNAANQFETRLPTEAQRPNRDPHDQASPPNTTLQGE